MLSFRSARWFALVAACALTLGLVACDSSGGDGPPTAQFEAEISGSVQKTLRGPAGLAGREEAGNALGGIFGVFPPPDSLDLPGVPDSLATERPDTLVPAGTALFLRDEGSSGDGISLFVQGDGLPETGTYSLDLFSLGGGQPDPASDIEGVALYTALRDSTFRIVPASQGTLTIEEASDDVLRGRFNFSTLLALDIRLPAPGDTSFADNVNQQFFQTSVEGTFTATRAADARPPFPGQ